MGSVLCVTFQAPCSQESVGGVMGAAPSRVCALEVVGWRRVMREGEVGVGAVAGAVAGEVERGASVVAIVLVWGVMAVR